MHPRPVHAHNLVAEPVIAAAAAVLKAVRAVGALALQALAEYPGSCKCYLLAPAIYQNYVFPRRLGKTDQNCGTNSSQSLSFKDKIDQTNNEKQ
ncbi:MAG: hypothetical protein JRN20_16215 [Nitrososphaerota archaeon]|nr:hypothetical protein [Nitrososphaerota archaeon]